MNGKTFTKSQQDALDYTRHIALTANAGSGKTYVLTERLLAILTKDSSVSIKNIAAITFTEKAASELYKKIAKALDEQVETSTDPDEKDRFIRFRKYLVSAQITTIHAFCANLLREFPVEAGIDAEFAIVDAYSASQMIDQCLSSLLEEMKDDPLLLNVLRFLKGAANFSVVMNIFLGRREILESLRKTIYSGTKADVVESQRETYKEQVQALVKGALAPGLAALNHVNDEVLVADAKNKYALEIRSCLAELAVETPKSGLAKNGVYLLLKIQEHGYKKDFTPKLTYVKKVSDGFDRHTLNAIIELFELLDFVGGEDDEYATQIASIGYDLIDLFDRLMSKYNQKKKENAYLDFDDLALLTKKLLENDFVKSSLADRFKYIMVDEYQDTNELQYEIFMPMLNELQRGNLFIVGDEKQSIYMFRNADLETFSKTRNDIIRKESETASIVLKESFRMAPELGLFVNRIFEVLFGQPNEIFNESRHSDIICVERQPKQGTLTFLIAKSGAGDETADDAETEIPEEKNNVIREAELIAKQILKMKSEYGLAWKDFAVLSYKNDALNVFRSVFPMHAIPYLIYGGKGFTEMQTVLDISCYLQFLTDERNDLALAAILKSPFYLCDDTVLMNIAACPGGSYFARLRNYAEKDDRVKAAYDLLSRHLLQAKYSGAPQLLRAILDDTSFMAVAAHRPNGDQIIADIEKVVAMAISRESQGFQNLYDFSGFLRDSIEEGIDESKSSVAVDNDAVQLMTLHKSKGLEFKVVILCEANRRFNSVKLSEGTVYADKRFGIVTKVPENENYFGDYKTPHLAGLYNFMQRKKHQAEQKRYLYVALTRAEEHLVISATLNKKDGIDGNSFLAYMAEALGDGIVQADFVLEGDIQCLSADRINETPETRHLTAPVAVLNDLTDVPVVEVPNLNIAHEYKINLAAVPEVKEAYSISASGYVRYTQCPLKFHLYQHQRLHEFLESANTEDLELDDDPAYETGDEKAGNDVEIHRSGKLPKGFAMLRGSILHTLLEENIEPSLAKEKAADLIEESLPDDDTINISQQAEQLAADYGKFRQSAFYTAIQNEQRVENEYEVAAVLDDKIFLQGRIDRVVWQADCIHLVDWKTDRVPEKQLKERCVDYEKQLLFYAYIVSRLFPEQKRIKFSLAFVSHPGFIHDGEFTKEDFARFENDIRAIVETIESREYSKNLKHCPKCVFCGEDGACVVNA